MSKFKLFDFLSRDGFYLTQGYGVNPANYTKYGLLYHEGIDLGHQNKTAEIRALHDGIVVQDWDEPKGNYGEYVVIWDDAQKIATWYCHMSENFVDYGQRVKAGDVIGKMGATGNVTGPHLHLNFVQTDTSGNRLYNTKSSNLGFLDPQHPLDPNPPKFPPGVPSYQVEWLTPQEESMTDQSPWLANSDKWIGLGHFLEIEDPTNTPLDKVKSIIAGLKSRATDMAKQASYWETEAGNRTEQVSRLKDQLLEEQTLRKDLSDKLNKAISSAGDLAGVYEGQLASKQTLIDSQGKTIGELNHKIADLEVELKNAKSTNPQKSWIEILLDFIKNLKK